MDAFLSGYIYASDNSMLYSLACKALIIPLLSAEAAAAVVVVTMNLIPLLKCREKDKLR